MERPLGHAEEVRALQRCMNDLISILALPAMWSGGEPELVVSTLLDSLLGMLGLDVVYARVKTSNEREIVTALKLSPQHEPARSNEIHELLNRTFDDAAQTWPAVVHASVGGEQLRLVPVRLGVSEGAGIIVAGSHRPDFPQQKERVLLSVAANQAAIGLQEARLLSQQRRSAREMEATLRNTQAELAHIARVMTMGELTASIAHEIKQPLAGIMVNASTCLRMLADEALNLDGARETARRIIRDANRAADVVTRLRALFTKKEIAAEAIDINEVTREVITLFSAQLGHDRVLVRTELAENLPAVMGDRIQLQQVILNLLTNAVDALAGVDNRPREVLVETQLEQADRVRVDVRDNGVGFNPHDSDKLFTAFYTTKNSGMGIGLSVSRSIVESHGGRLWATANDGPGATFSFCIPRDSGAAVLMTIPRYSRIPS